MKMKTAKELYNKHKELMMGYHLMDSFCFTKALTEDRKQIKGLMLDRIKQLHDEIRNHPDRKKGLVSKLSEIERFRRKFESKIGV